MTGKFHAVRGPNVWASCPVIEGILDLEPQAWPADQIRQTLERLDAALFPNHSENLHQPTLFDLAQLTTRVATRLQAEVGNPVSFSAVRAAVVRPDRFLLAIEYAEEPVGLAAAETALNFLLMAQAGKPISVAEELQKLKKLAYDQSLPASVAVIANAARARGIPAALLSPEYGRFLRLGHGSKQRRCLASETDGVSGVARMASTDKYLAKQLLAQAGVPVPLGKLASSAEQAWAAACELGLPVAIKPLDSDLATGVSLDLRTREQVEAGFRNAAEHSYWVMIERFAPGLEHRVLVVGDRISAVTRIDPPHVVGDGVSSVEVLVHRVNQDPRRGDGEGLTPLRKLKIDEVALEVLAAQGYSLPSVPAIGERVLVRRNPPYFKNGGNLVDLTDAIHPSTAAHAIAASQALRIPVAGLDVVAVDISQPLEGQGGVIVEINAGPGLWLHMAPWADSPRPIGVDIVASLFSQGEEGRIPVIAAVGDHDGSAKRHLTALLTHAGLRVGLLSGEEITVGERHWRVSSPIVQERARILLQNPSIDAAILETSPAELVREGFGNDRCDVAIVLDLSAEVHPVDADEDRPQPGEFLRALLHALSPSGTLILLARDAAKVEMGLPVERIVFIARDGDDPSSWMSHLEAGGTILRVSEGKVMLVTCMKGDLELGRVHKGVSKSEIVGLLAVLTAGVALRLKTGMLMNYLERAQNGE